jgi:hypothetical protein
MPVTREDCSRWSGNCLGNQGSKWKFHGSWSCWENLQQRPCVWDSNVVEIPFSLKTYPGRWFSYREEGLTFPMSLSNRAFWDHHDCLWTGWWSHPPDIGGLFTQFGFTTGMCTQMLLEWSHLLDLFILVAYHLWSVRSSPVAEPSLVLHSKESKICAEGKACGILCLQCSEIDASLKPATWICLKMWYKPPNPFLIGKWW